MEWLFGRQPRPAARVIRVPQERAQRSYQPRRRSSPVYRQSAPAIGDRPAAVQPLPPAQQGPALDPEAPLQASPPAEVAQPAPSVQEPAQRPISNVAVIGDSISIFLAQGLQELYGEPSSVNIIKRNREASGLVRDDYFDWPRQLRDLIASNPRLDAIIVQIGSNDRQPLRDADGEHAPRTERWLTLYGKRIDELLSVAREKNIPVVWVGLPPMRSERYSADLLAFNALYKSHVAAAGQFFVDAWEPFTGEDGHYVVNGPDVEGSIVRLRTADGVHFTKAGGRKLAFFADKEIKKILSEKNATPVSPNAAATIATIPTAPQITVPQSAEPIPVPNVVKSIDTLLGIAAPDIPLLSNLTPRPAQGTTMSLTAPPSTPGGILVERDISQPTMSMPSVPAKPGRTDDFATRSLK